MQHGIAVPDDSLDRGTKMNKMTYKLFNGKLWAYIDGLPHHIVGPIEARILARKVI